MTNSPVHQQPRLQAERLRFADLQIPNDDVTMLKEFYAIHKDDEKKLASARDFAETSAHMVIEGFYKHVLSFPETQKFFSDPAVLERAKKAQANLLADMTSGRYDSNYVEDRLNVGQTHNRVNLTPKWYIGSFSSYLNILADELVKNIKNPQETLAVFRAFVKIVLLDIGVAMEAFVIDRRRRLGHRLAEAETIVKSLPNVTSKLSAVASELSSATSQTVSAMAETTATAEEVRQTAEQCNQKAREITHDARTSVQVCRQGIEATDFTVEGMLRIREQMESVSQCMVQLSNQSKLIGDIIASVDDLAQQSNLLAVNASIEAAKAGEQGKGFAVVAQEVKNLSQQSKAATAQVRKILNDIVKATSAAKTATEQGSKAVALGHQQASDAGRVIKTLAEIIEKTAQSTELIQVSSQQQLEGMRQMVEAMESMKQSSQQNIQGAQQLDSASRELDNISQQLNLFTSGRS